MGQRGGWGAGVGGPPSVGSAKGAPMTEGTYDGGITPPHPPPPRVARPAISRIAPLPHRRTETLPHGGPLAEAQGKGGALAKPPHRSARQTTPITLRHHRTAGAAEGGSIPAQCHTAQRGLAAPLGHTRRGPGPTRIRNHRGTETRRCDGTAAAARGRWSATPQPVWRGGLAGRWSRTGGVLQRMPPAAAPSDRGMPMANRKAMQKHSPLPFGQKLTVRHASQNGCQSMDVVGGAKGTCFGEHRATAAAGAAAKRRVGRLHLFWPRPKMSWRRPLTLQYLRQPLGIKVQSCPVLR